MAKEAFEVLRCRDWVRADFILDRHDEPYLLENEHHPRYRPAQFSDSFRRGEWNGRRKRGGATSRRNSLCTLPPMHDEQGHVLCRRRMKCENLNSGRPRPASSNWPAGAALLPQQPLAKLLHL